MRDSVQPLDEPVVDFPELARSSYINIAASASKRDRREFEGNALPVQLHISYVGEVHELGRKYAQETIRVFGDVGDDFVERAPCDVAVAVEGGIDPPKPVETAEVEHIRRTMCMREMHGGVSGPAAQNVAANPMAFAQLHHGRRAKRTKECRCEFDLRYGAIGAVSDG